MTTVMGARNVGASIKRSEDPRILTGRGRYVDDVVVPDMLHGAFLRSSVAHARLVSVDVSGARELPGVIAVYTGEDMMSRTKLAQAGAITGRNAIPGINVPTLHFALATDKVRFVGDPIALVVAESRYIAEDALELIVEDWEILDSVMTYEDALDPTKPNLFSDLENNIALASPLAIGDVDDVFARADQVIKTTMSVHRHQNVPMEGRGSVHSWDPETRKLTIHSSTQSPHMFRMMLPAHLDIAKEDIRVMAGDVGGAFGLKVGLFREDIALAAATIDLGRPIKWIEDRGENLTASGQAREEMADIEAAVTNDGQLLGVKMDIKLNSGAYPCEPFIGSSYILALSAMFQGPCKLQALSANHTAVFSNKATYVAYRGPWASADFMRERLFDVIARELNIEPIDVRRRNYVTRGEEPLTMLTGQPFVGVTTMETLERAAEIIDWPAFRARQLAARADGRYLGLGIASYIEAAPGPRNYHLGGVAMGDEFTHISLERDGKIAVITQQQPHGQGHETTLAQVAADELGVRFEDVVVRYGDTSITPQALVATGGSRAATFANGAVLHVSRELRQKLLSVAAELLEANADDLEIDNGTISVRGTPAIQLPLTELARIAEEEPNRMPAGTETELKVTGSYDGGEGGWSGGTHCCIVEVDVETGFVHIERYLVIEDCGFPVNPAIVDGQIRGGIAQGIGAVLLERSAYNEDGQFMAGTFMDYLMPITTGVPNFEIHHVDAVAVDPDVNFRGVGEGGMIVSPATICNAIEDALAPFGAKVREQHLPPCRILELVGVIPTE